MKNLLYIPIIAIIGLAFTPAQAMTSNEVTKLETNQESKDVAEQNGKQKPKTQKFIVTVPTQTSNPEVLKQQLIVIGDLKKLSEVIEKDKQEKNGNGIQSSRSVSSKASVTPSDLPLPNQPQPNEQIQSANSCTPFNEEHYNEAQKKQKHKKVKLIAQEQPRQKNDIFTAIADELEKKREAEKEVKRKEEIAKERELASNTYIQEIKNILKTDRDHITNIVQKKLVAMVKNKEKLSSMGETLPDRVATTSDLNLIVRGYFARKFNEKYIETFKSFYDDLEKLNTDAARDTEEALKKYYDKAPCCCIIQ